MKNINKLKINHVSAHEGKIELHIGLINSNPTNDSIVASDDKTVLAWTIKKFGFNPIYTSAGSSMDYAKENGFSNDDDAKKLFRKAVRLSKKKLTNLN